MQGQGSAYERSEWYWGRLSGMEDGRRDAHASGLRLKARCSDTPGWVAGTRPQSYGCKVKMRTVWVRYSADLFEPSYHLNLPFNARLVAPMRCQLVALASSLRHHLREGSNELTAVYKEGVSGLYSQVYNYAKARLQR